MSLRSFAHTDLSCVQDLHLSYIGTLFHGDFL